MTISVTSEFQQEFETDRTNRLRKRFLWYTGVVLVIGAVQFLVGGVAFLFNDEFADTLTSLKLLATFQVALSLVILGLYLWAFLFVRSRNMERAPTLRLLYWLIVISGTLAFGVQVITFEALSSNQGAPTTTQQVESPAGTDVQTPSLQSATPTITTITQPATREPTSQGIIFGSLSNLFVTHFFACLFLPWTPRESIRPLLPLFALLAIVTVIYLETVFGMVFTLAIAPTIALPGAMICWWRQSKYHTDFHYRKVRYRYGEMKRELTDARKIHDALFPEPVLEGPVVFDYAYEPNRHIGGDFVFYYTSKDESGDIRHTSVVLIDVTGHGIPAALTVNRLHGELERTFGENPDVSPGEVLSALNSYVHFALASHSVFATAICFRIDPALDSIQYASGGHPPAFIRTADARIEQLHSTAFVLGVCHGEDFKPEQETLPFMRGDVLIACTDGATEANNNQRGMLRIDGFLRIVASQRRDNASPERWCTSILRTIEGYRSGPPQDDTLIVELSRPIGTRGTPKSVAVASQS